MDLFNVQRRALLDECALQLADESDRDDLLYTIEVARMAHDDELVQLAQDALTILHTREVAAEVAATS